MNMTRREWVTKVFLGERVPRVPTGFWFHFLDNDVISSGLEDPTLIDKNLDGHRKMAEIYLPDFIKMMTDGLFYRPSSTYPSLRNAHDLAYVKPLEKDHVFFDACIAHAKKVRTIFGDDILIFYNIPSPLHHLLKEMTGTSSMKTFPAMIRDDPKAFAIARDALLEDMLHLTERVLTEGATDGIYFSLHDDDAFTREQYETYIMPSELAILNKANAIQPIHIAHICGFHGRVNHFDFYRDYPATAFNWSLHTTEMTLKEGKDFFTKAKSVIGGFDQMPGSLIHRGTKDEIQAFVFDLLDKNGTVGILLGADCTLPPDTPLEHLVWAQEACEHYAKKLRQAPKEDIKEHDDAKI